MWSDLWQYYGIDWVAMLFTMIAIWQLGNQQRMGFILMIIGNLCWIGLGVFTASIALIVANSVFAGMNVRGILKWSAARETS